MRALLLLTLLASGLASAQEDAPVRSDAPVASSALDAGISLFPAPVFEPPPPVFLKPRRNFLLPILESEALHFVLAGANNLILRESFAQISFDSIASHFDGRRPWEADVDLFEINQFGHPLQGALSFTAARSSGLSFWWACLYPFMSSLTWEMFFEVDAPSWNDQITTPTAGIFLGEVLHRFSLLFLRDAPLPKWARVLFSAILDPMGSLNRAMLDHSLDAQDVDASPPAFVMIGGGVHVGSAYRDASHELVRSYAVQGNIQGRLTYGMPGDPNFKYNAPFSHFDVDVNASFPTSAVVSLFMRGLLTGAQFGNGATRGLWGIFGQYDFATAPLVRMSSVGIGLGTSFQSAMDAGFTLQLAAVVSAVPFSSAGSLELTEGASLLRDYHIGPGGQATVEARLIWNDRAWLRVVARSWLTAGLYTGARGWESITYVTAGPLVRVWGPVALGADVVLAVRQAKFADDTYDRSVAGTTFRATVNWVSSESLGAVR